MANSAFPIRRTARLIVLNPANQLLLIRYRATHLVPPLTAAEPTFYYTPGGGIDPGETTREAAARELDEECGIRGVDISPAIALRQAEAPWFAKQTFAVETYHFARSADSRLDTSRLAETDDQEAVDVGWHALEALTVSKIPIIPPGLIGLARRCAAGEVFGEPLMLRA